MKVFIDKLNILFFFMVIAVMIGVAFSRLGWGSLASFDEAWYADIASNVYDTGNPLQLIYNDNTFRDHPPAGIILMALSYAVLGESEFSTRVVSAALGIGSIFLVYILGTTLFSQKTGILASAMLASSLWFVLRVRSGNLDIPFLFFYLLTLYFAYVSIKKSVYIYSLAVAFALLMLTKTLIGASVIVPIAFLYSIHRKDMHLDVKQAIGALGMFLVILLPWYVYNASIDAGFLRHHFITIGTRERSQSALLDLNIKEVVQYLYYGIGKWFPLFLALLPFSVFIATYRRNLLFLIAWFIAVTLPFALTTKAEIWHLIPAYPPMLLFSSAVIVYMTGLVEKLVNKRWSGLPAYLLSLLVLCGVAGIFFVQTNGIIPLVIPTTDTISVEEDIGKRVRAYEGNVSYVEVLLPSVVYYSNRYIIPLGFVDGSYELMREKLGFSKEKENFIITKENRLKLMSENVPFKDLENNGHYWIISN